MGRTEKKIVQHQHHQGFEAVEAIDVHDDIQDLYEPPPEFQKPPKAEAFPPDEPKAEAFPPLHHHEPIPEEFPPRYHNEPQAFPPTAQHFPATELPSSSHQPQNAQFVSPQPINFNIPQPPVGVISQGMFPTPLIINNPMIPQPWKTGLFECMNDPANAVITLLFPCITFGQIAEILDSGRTSCGTSGMRYVLISCCIAMPCLMTCSYRTKLRSRFGLTESPAPDCLVHCFCECCALCQEYRELNQRGFDPSIGYFGNVAKQQQQQQQLIAMAMTPPKQQRMM